MISLPSKSVVLCAEAEGRLCLFRRSLDKPTSSWRYRCVGFFDPSDDTLHAYGAFCHNNPDTVAAARAVHERFVSTWPDLSMLSLSFAAVRAEMTPDDAELLMFHADLFRAYQVNNLLVTEHLAGTSGVHFPSWAPVLNLIVALDLRQSGAHVLSSFAPALVETARSDGFRDDRYHQAAGALRALSELYGRHGQPEAELDALDLSIALAPRAGKLERRIELLTAKGDDAGVERDREALQELRAGGSAKGV